MQCTDNCSHEFNKKVGSQGTFSRNDNSGYNINHIYNYCRCVPNDDDDNNKNNSTTAATSNKNVYSSFSNANKKTLSAFNSLK